MILSVKETHSTNDLLKQLLGTTPLEEATVVVAHTQSRGRGQTNNSWEAEPGLNLTFSLLLRPSFVRPAEQFILSQAVALGVIDTLSREVDELAIKWPNDIYWRDRKIGGILIENQLTGGIIDTCIVGIGININQERFLSDAPNPVSLKQITGREYPLDGLLTSVVSSIMNRYHEVREGNTESLRTQYLSSLYLRGVEAPFKDKLGCFTGVISGVRPTGHLEVKTHDGTLRLYAFKEIQFRGCGGV